MTRRKNQNDYTKKKIIELNVKRHELFEFLIRVLKALKKMRLNMV